MLVSGIIAKKIGMTQVFEENGVVVPVTVLQAGPCVVAGIRSVDRDGYEAAQLALVDPRAAGRVSRPLKGQFDKVKLPPSRTLGEFAMLGEVKVGDSITASEFSVGELVDIVGNSKGLGFQGVMRRHGFGGGRASHGSMFHRAPGSIGASAFPSRVFKGMRAAGRDGGRRTTMKNLRVVRVDEEKNLLLVRGAVPGKPGATLRIQRAKAGGKRQEKAKAAAGAAGKA